MKLKKIECYLKEHPLDEGTNIFYVPSGYKGVWLEVSEDYAYNVGVNYVHESQEGELAQAIKELNGEKEES